MVLNSLNYGGLMIRAAALLGASRPRGLGGRVTLAAMAFQTIRSARVSLLKSCLRGWVGYAVFDIQTD